ncbi:hypothetical protein N1851_000488 [Merluccius polli]|uniref:Uncharacterized protein n=1 Tax=Merluccius polli TaxID=89951 RepID=A0AA47ND06_MERPO|nr:hypothetical protein N1851_000488 [Merluccius polli]
MVVQNMLREECSSFSKSDDDIGGIEKLKLNFHFTIRYRPGKENVDADSLSRMPVNIEVIMEQCTEELTSDSNALCVCPVLTSLQCTAVSEDIHKTFSVAKIRQAQQDDVNISQIIQCKLSNKKPAGHDLNALNQHSGSREEYTTLLHEWERIHMDEDGILCRKTTNKTQLVFLKGIRALY